MVSLSILQKSSSIYFHSFFHSFFYVSISLSLSLSLFSQNNLDLFYFHFSDSLALSISFLLLICSTNQICPTKLSFHSDPTFSLWLVFQYMYSSRSFLLIGSFKKLHPLAWFCLSLNGTQPLLLLVLYPTNICSDWLYILHNLCSDWFYILHNLCSDWFYILNNLSSDLFCILHNLCYHLHNLCTVGFVS